MDVLYDGSDPNVLANQKVIDEHRNWHCEHGAGGTEGEGSGKRFLAFHKQFILDYDLWRQFPDRRQWGGTGLGQTNLGDHPIIMGWPINNSGPMPIGHPDCLHGSPRATGAVCPTCVALPTMFRLSGTLETYTSADLLGQDLGEWHLNAYHCPIAQTGCEDIGPSATTPRDPMFWRAHKILDDVHSTWQRQLAADVVIVLDRSGSMSGSHEGGGTKLQAAKDAIREFVALFSVGEPSFVGLVSYSTNASDASQNMSLTAAPDSLGADVMDPNDGILDMTLNGIVAGGGTSMGAGIREALSQLEARRTAGVASEHQAILLLTDGMENTAPCLGGRFCSGAMVDPSEFLIRNSSGIHVGDVQLCVVGFGREGTLDSDLLATLTEREGGIYVAGDVDPVGLKKFFVTCFSSLFTSALAVDPFGTMLPNDFVSTPVSYSACPAGDSQITFVLAWNDPGDPLQLSVSTPAGNLVDLADVAVENVIGPDFHIVRFPLPYKGEHEGDWTGLALRLDPPGVEQRYFISTLVKGPGRVDPFSASFRHETGNPLVPTFRISEPNMPIDGYDAVAASVFVTRPLQGTGNLLAELGLDGEMVVAGDVIDRRTATLLALKTSALTTTEEYPLFDDGTNGDLYANDHYWSVRLPESDAALDGTYHFRAVFQLKKDGCTIRREAEHTVYVDVGVRPEGTDVQVQTGDVLPDGRMATAVRIRPGDGFGNLLGPGLSGTPSCGPVGQCEIDPQSPIIDHEDGWYTINVISEPGAATASLDAFGATFHVPIACPECPSLEDLKVDDVFVVGSNTVGTLRLSGPAPGASVSGAVIALQSSVPELVSVPNNVTIPLGMEGIDFPIEVGHVHDDPGEPVTVTISATYGAVTLTAELVQKEVGPGDKDDCDDRLCGSGTCGGGGTCMLLFTMLGLLRMRPRRRA